MRKTAENIEQVRNIVPVIAPLTVACKANGIGRTTAWKLAKLKLLDTIHIGRKCYVVLSSFDKLAERLDASNGGDV